MFENLKRGMLFNRAQRYARAGRVDEALKLFERLTGQAPDWAIAKSHHAMALARKGNFGDAVDAATQAMGMAPDDFAVALFAGQVFFDAGRLEDARGAFEKAAEIESDNTLPRSYLALTQMATGDSAEGYKNLSEIGPERQPEFQARLLVVTEQELEKDEKKK